MARLVEQVGAKKSTKPEYFTLRNNKTPNSSQKNNSLRVAQLALCFQPSPEKNESFIRTSHTFARGGGSKSKRMCIFARVRRRRPVNTLVQQGAAEEAASARRRYYRAQPFRRVASEGFTSAGPRPIKGLLRFYFTKVEI